MSTTFTDSIIILKFGGTSVGDAKRIFAVADIVANSAIKNRVGVVVSAVSGVTNLLVSAMNEAKLGKEVNSFTDQIVKIHESIIKEMATSRPDLRFADTRKILRLRTEELKDILEGVRLICECSLSVSDRVLSYGERFSAAILNCVFESMNINCRYIQAENYIITDEHFGQANPDFSKISENFQNLKNETWDVLLCSGFYGASESGKITTLGRGGSDYSAAIIAAALNAQLLEIWSDVDGMYSADPRIVPESFLISEMSYEEAMEMAFFGAKILHPRTLVPVVEKQIPTALRNTFNPSHAGTRIFNNAPESECVIRGITTLDSISLINLTGPGMQGVAGIAARMFGALARSQISIIFISQASSEYAISICISSSDATHAEKSLTLEFKSELESKKLNKVEAQSNLAIISIIGDKMRSKKGVASIFFDSLASTDVNIIAIAQGSSERNISVVIANADQKKALKKTHEFFFRTRLNIDIFIVGTGSVGAKLIEQIKNQQKNLLNQKVDIRICGLANSKKMIFKNDGIDLSEWQKILGESQNSYNLSGLLETILKERPINAVFIDCTGSLELAERYPDIFDAGLHISTPSKRANTLSQEYYFAIRKKANSTRRRFLYETNVGAGLPVIETIKNFVKSGDQLVQFEGILSGSLSYIFGRLSEGKKFSEALAEARDKQFTEPDPRDDLCGLDVARKLLILARETGEHLELSNIEVLPAWPKDFDASGNLESFMQKLPILDKYFELLISDAAKLNQEVRYIASIKNNKCKVGIEYFETNHPLAQIKNGENALSFTTRRYSPTPLVIRGYGAGPDVTAAGIFADILQTVHWNMDLSQ